MCSICPDEFVEVNLDPCLSVSFTLSQIWQAELEVILPFVGLCVDLAQPLASLLEISTFDFGRD